MIWFRRVLFLAIGLVITVIAFRFWNNFATLMGHLSAAPPPHAVAAPANPNEVTVGIIPAQPPKKDCDKQHPCR
jgi:hypothetical protein